MDPEQGRVLEQEVQSLLAKEAIELIPPHERESEEFTNCNSLFQRRNNEHPILDLRHLNQSLRRFRFKILTIPLIVSQIKSED